MNDNIDNALVRQKNHILTLIYDERFEEAITLLDFSAELWAECEYAYKTQELRERIRIALRDTLPSAHWKQREKLNKMVAKL